MQFLQTITAILASTLFNFAFSAPLDLTEGSYNVTNPPLKRQIPGLAPVADNTQTCYSTCFGGCGQCTPTWASVWARYVAYTIVVGRPYIDGAGCPSIFDAVSNEVGGITSDQFKCLTYGSQPGTPITVPMGHNTELYFLLLPGHESELTTALEGRYPDVLEGFTCHQKCPPTT